MMAKENIPLKEVSIEKLYMDSDQMKYEIPIYQRNYAWEKDEIVALIQDVYDAYKKDSKRYYYVGTLVSFHKGESVYEIIDGQQRLTTIRIILSVLGIVPKTRLTYKARKKSDETLKNLNDLKKVDEVIGSDFGIVNGLTYAKEAYKAIVPEEDQAGYIDYFKSKVHLIHYKVPKDIDLNHYFEIMNSRGEQLEKYEIVKANLMEALDRKKGSEMEMELFNQIWECCSDMSVYIQQSLKYVDIFGANCNEFLITDYNSLKSIDLKKTGQNEKKNKVSIEEIIKTGVVEKITEDEDKKDSFQPIIDFSNFLLIVLKITLMKKSDFIPSEFDLDDKELLHEFDAAKIDPRDFIFNLLKSRYLLDNYIVHHSKEDDTIDNNPWKLQKWTKDGNGKQGYIKGYPRNTAGETDIQNKLVHLLSMFEVSFTAKQRKNYLFYCLLYLIDLDVVDTKEYAEFVEGLANRYFNNVYLEADKLSSINVPMPGAFDNTVLKENKFDQTDILVRTSNDFYTVYGNGEEISKGIPLFVFNYLDYIIWKEYSEKLRGEKSKLGSQERKAFFDLLGCEDFGLKIFDQFYFSRTRRSLEHYYPQATANGLDGNLNQAQINCIGNYAMIGSEANSAGSNWSPKTKLDHYLDSSGKINQISVASLKFMVMMQMCKDADKWQWDEIRKHQENMVNILFKQK